MQKAYLLLSWLSIISKLPLCFSSLTLESDEKNWNEVYGTIVSSLSLNVADKDSTKE